MRVINDRRFFVDRSNAGRELGKILAPKYKDKNALILGIPRGGVIIAYEIAKVLNGELSVVITKKLPHPQQAEFGIGAVAEDGSVYLSPDANYINPDSIDRILSAQKNEIKSRIQRFRNDRPLPD